MGICVVSILGLLQIKLLNICEQVFVWTYAIISFGELARKGMAALYSRYLWDLDKQPWIRREQKKRTVELA